VIGTDNHNLYEEYPVIGAVVEQVFARLDRHGGGDVPSELVPNGTTATPNLLGYASRQPPVRREVLAWLEDQGFSDPLPNLHNTGISYPVLKNISEYLGTLSAFKIHPVDITQLPRQDLLLS